MLRILLGTLCLFATVGSATAQDAPPPPEMYRVRVVNETGGAVEISADRGTTWDALGKVTHPASTSAIASNVISLVPPGAVAGVTGNSLLVRLPAVKSALRSLRILAQGEAESAATITTDIPARGSLFRWAAPPVGSTLLIERDAGPQALPSPYTPRVGDRLVIVVSQPAAGEAPVITLENKPDGEVVLTQPDALPRLLGRVKQPLKGIGRYSGTERAGSGRVLAWSPTAVIVSTASTARKLDPNGELAEERGGFVIQPAEPALQGTTHPDSQILVEGVPEDTGRPPVSTLFAMPVFLSTGDPQDTRQTRVEVRIDEGPWEPLPDLRGTIQEADLPKAIETALGGGRTCKTGITHLRLIYAELTRPTMQRRLLMAVTPLAEDPQRGRVTITANVMGEGVREVHFLLNGRVVRTTNIPPYTWVWNTLPLPNGEHLLEVRGLDAGFNPITTARRRVIVDN